MCEHDEHPGFDAPYRTVHRAPEPATDQQHSSTQITQMHVTRIFISEGHNFFGHHGKPAGDHSAREVQTIECVAGKGIRGDRFFDHKPDYKGQITFFDERVWIELCHHFRIHHLDPSVLRRNVIVRGHDLNSLIGREFEIQGVRFIGTGECSPCYWMDSAFHPGTEVFLKDRGGLRAKILTSGNLAVPPTVPPTPTTPI